MSKIIIDEDDITKYVGRYVINEAGVRGKVVHVLGPDDSTYRVGVSFFNGIHETYTIDGYQYKYSKDQYIEFEEEIQEDSEVATRISKFLSDNRLSAEELIALLLENHCE